MPMEWTEILFAGFLMVLGMLMLFIEVALIPGFGLVGVAGGALLGAGIVLVWAGLGAMWGIIALLVSVPLTVLAMVWFMKSKASGKLVLKGAIRSHSSDVPTLTRLVGLEGTAMTTLRPAGTALIDNERRDVVSEGEFIEKGTPIIVVRIDQNSLIVTRK